MIKNIGVKMIAIIEHSLNTLNNLVQLHAPLEFKARFIVKVNKYYRRIPPLDRYYAEVDYACDCARSLSARIAQLQTHLNIEDSASDYWCNQSVFPDVTDTSNIYRNSIG